MTTRLAAFLFGAAMLVSPLAARADVADAPFAARTVAERTAAMVALDAAPDGPDKRMAIATLAAFAAIERFGQALHRHGFRSPNSMLVPLMRLPVPENPNPEPLTYEAWRITLAGLLFDLDAAKGLLRDIEPDADIGIEVDLSALRFDLDADGNLSDAESVLAIFEAFDPGADGRRTEGSSPPPVFRFDRADAYWLEGYANFLTANARLWLAHDFEKTFDTSFGLFFPREAPAAAPRSAWSDEAIFDVVSLIHTVAWPVAEPEMRKAVLVDLKDIWCGCRG